MYPFSNPSARLPPLPVAFGPIFPITPPPEAGWSWVNQETATVTYKNKTISLYTPKVDGDHVRLYLQTAPSKPYTVDACVAVGNPGGGGICWYDTATGRIIVLNTDLNPKISYLKYNSVTSYSGSYADIDTSVNRRYQFLRLYDSDTLRQAFYSETGIDWIQVYSGATNDFLTPTNVGLFLNPQFCLFDSITLSCFSWKVY